VELDRQSVERRDFPISRRGYDPAAVDAHLRTLAVDIEELTRSLEDRGGETLGSAAGTQVQSILEAAEATAADIVQQATALALSMREEASRDAERTRSEAVARAQRHVQAVSQATAVLRERVESMDGEVSALVQSLRAGAGRLAADLGSVETNMGELYDAASGTDAAGGEGVEGAEHPQIPSAAALPATAALREVAAEEEHWPLDTEAPLPEGGAQEESPRPKAAANGAERAAAPTAPSIPGGPAESPAYDDDLDGARLIALNMALNGEPREQADRYLAENFELADRAKLLDEVYAAIEG
jgi:DivIVA domain-containing protein